MKPAFVAIVWSLLILPGIGATESPEHAAEASYPRTLYLVRHGTYDYQEGVDPDRGLPLIPLGIAQAKLVAARLRGMPVVFDSLTASTMTRARETALVIGEQFPSLSLQTTPLLRECSPPTLPRPGKDDTVSKEAADCEQQLNDAFKTYFVPAKGAEKRELLVCHGNVIRYFVTKALGVDTRAWLGMSVANASLTVIRVSPTGTFQVLSVGDVGHLPPSLVTGWTSHDPQLTVPHSAP
jgi:serine/threonine-protein phosphatase PGAM5